MKRACLLLALAACGPPPPPADQTALATFIKSVPAVSNQVPRSTFVMRPLPGPPPSDVGSAAPTP